MPPVCTPISSAGFAVSSHLLAPPKTVSKGQRMAADRHHLMPMWAEPARNSEMLYFNFLGNLTKLEESPKGLFLCCKVLILFQHLTLSTEQSLHPLCPCWLSKGSVLANATPATKSSAQMSLCAHCVIMDIIIQNEKTKFNHQIGPVWVVSAFRWHNDAVTFILMVAFLLIVGRPFASLPHALSTVLTSFIYFRHLGLDQPVLKDLLKRKKIKRRENRQIFNLAVKIALEMSIDMRPGGTMRLSNPLTTSLVRSLLTDRKHVRCYLSRLMETDFPLFHRFRFPATKSHFQVKSQVVFQSRLGCYYIRQRGIILSCIVCYTMVIHTTLCLSRCTKRS